MRDRSVEQQWRDNWLDVSKRPLGLADLTCECGYVPDWMEPCPGTTPYLSSAQSVKRERQQSQLMFHLQATQHRLLGVHRA